MKKFVIHDVQVVGMHHYGRRELEVGGVYKVDAEPSNEYDPNAVAIYDGSRKIGNLKRDCAAAVSRIIKEDKAKSNYYLKPLFEAVVKNRRTGPQQKCAIAFKCAEEHINELLCISEEFNCISVKVTNL